MYFQSVNGKKVNKISINDRGLAYGDGIFTTAKIANGEVKLFKQHIERLKSGCNLLKISGVDYNALSLHLIDIAKSYELAVLKIVITSGEGGRGYSRVGVGQPNIIIKVSEFPAKYTQWKNSGISLGDASIQLGINPMFAGLKHLNRLEQVLIRDELDQTSFDDLLVLNIHKHIIETTCANVFWFKGDELYTPEISDSGVAGIFRAELLRKKPTIHIVKENRLEILNADAIFITNSIMEIVPIINYAQRDFSLEKVHQFKAHIETLT